ncbi:bactofilin family protein [Cohnella nanjingensis]|uniref:Polymer-forming cytoskeletal protein n=1 Tax=Cohnella nanjingensis TaxID=1387779 RepID=A0A7X0VGI0_9BACL|nr:polymer-forming cytoskeletal protein [Cohnella nanjingensis]MBB6671679.1 polymer-forming cytoskeletal protein [Cohnella nanjingensis]
MFKKKKKPSPSTTDTLIGAGTEMEGALKSQAGIRIEGVFKGEIDTRGDVVVGASGVARSNVAARDVTIAGKVYGDVVTKGRLTILSGGQLNGNLTAGVLVIHEGGQLNGVSHMERSEAKTAVAVDPAAERDKADKKARQAG